MDLYFYDLNNYSYFHRSCYLKINNQPFFPYKNNKLIYKINYQKYELFKSDILKEKAILENFLKNFLIIMIKI